MRGYSQVSDTELIIAYKQGNQNALASLIQRYQEKIYNTIYYLVKDKYLTEDLFQEVFIKVIDTINGNRYNEEGKFLPWVLRIAHNLCIDHFRRIKRKPTILTGDNTNIFEWITVVEESKEEIMIKDDLHKELHAHLNKLSDEQREVVVLRHFADLSFKEIADITNCSINTALGRMRYALINLRKMMQEQQMIIA